MHKEKFYQIVHYLLLVLVVILILSGFGITNTRIIAFLTLGLLGKALAFKIHLYLVWPFIIIFIVHIFLTIMRRKK